MAYTVSFASDPAVFDAKTKAGLLNLEFPLGNCAPNPQNLSLFDETKVDEINRSA
jgi:hypothetical protein